MDEWKQEWLTENAHHVRAVFLCSIKSFHLKDQNTPIEHSTMLYFLPCRNCIESLLARLAR